MKFFSSGSLLNSYLSNNPTQTFMSIHAQLSDEAQARLDAQKRNSTILSMVIAGLSIVLILLVLGLLLLPAVVTETPTIVTYSSSITEDPDIREKKVNSQIQQKPSAPSNSMARVIASNAQSNVAIPVPEMDMNTVSTDFGDGEDFGGGWGDAGDSGAGGGFATIPATMRKRCSKEDRMQRLAEMGGNPKAEEVVERGLEWLKATQNDNGSWAREHHAGLTGLGVLAYLGRCETPISEKYGESCLRAITYLVDLGMRNNGKLAENVSDGKFPYEHAIAAYALSEALTFSKQLNFNVPNLEEVVQKSIDFIIQNQHERTGGWDYSYETTSSRGGDTSIAAWQVQALKAAKYTGLKFEGMRESMKAATEYMISMQNPGHGGFGYKNPHEPAHSQKGHFSMTGGGVLALQMMGKERSSAVRNGVDYILKHCKFDYPTYNSDLYAHYYEVQAMMTRGGRAWEKYNEMFRDQLINTQKENGDWEAPGRGGRYATDPHYRNCLNILMLETYYRFLPGTAAE